MGWKVYRKDLTVSQAKKVVERLIKNGKVWGQTVTTTNDRNKWTVHTKAR